MGIGSYFKADKGEKDGKQSAAPSPSPHAKRTSHGRGGVSSPSSFSEKAPSHDGDLQPPTPNFSSRPQSISARSMVTKAPCASRTSTLRSTIVS